MEDSLILGKDKQVEHVFLYKQFEKLCPYYISIGMTYEQFWFGDVSMTKAYQEAFDIKQKRKAIETKWTIWEQGLYIYEAFCDVSPILRPFSKATKPLQYSKEPYEIDKYYDEYYKKAKDEEKEEKEKEFEIMRTQIYFKNWANAAQKKFERKEEQNG